jgi:predicted RNA-binding Zn-ribbon protein involved in translation (DUF1610 family)
MSNRRIKGTHIPRLLSAGAALVVFFVTLYAHLVGHPIDFTQPLFAGVMVGFLLAGITMLLASWVIGLDTRAELLITVFMLALHLGFDAFIFVWVFVMDQAIPVALVQGVVQAYWIAGLIDVFLVYWASNWTRTASTYISPEQRVIELERELALEKQAHAQDEQRIAVQTVAQEWTCPDCGEVFEHTNADSLKRARRAHQSRWCPALKHAKNGHSKQPIPVKEN